MLGLIMHQKNKFFFKKSPVLVHLNSILGML